MHMHVHAPMLKIWQSHWAIDSLIMIIIGIINLGNNKTLTLNELCTKVSSKSMTMHFLCMSWCLIGGSSGRGEWSFITSSGGEARGSVAGPLGGPLPRPPRQQHSSDRRNPPLPLDFLLPMGVDPDTGVPSPSVCPTGLDPKSIQNMVDKFNYILIFLHWWSFFTIVHTSL